MSIYKEIATILEGLGIPCEPMGYSGKETTYITYTEYLSQGERSADNREIVTGHYIQVDIWSDTSRYLLITDEVKRRFLAAGWRRTTEADLPERENGKTLYHRALRFYIFKEDEHGK